MCIPWREWSPEAFALAREQRRPVLLSLVTAWSQGCAAMDATTFADPRVVALVGRHFIPVRVDADRRPDINERCNLGGWPTTVFLTADARLLCGGTFYDPDRMVAALQEVTRALEDRAGELPERADRRATVRDRGPRPPESSCPAWLRAAVLDRFDRRHGGFDRAPKLAHPGVLLFALSLAAEGDAALGEVAEATLDAVAALWDEAGGGYARSADGEDWTAVAGEKTLEDNAALLHVYVEAARVLPEGPWRDRAAAIARWAATTMRHGAGGFANAAGAAGTDRARYVDRNAMMIGALLGASSAFGDRPLRDAALEAFEAVVAPAYKPGCGVAHVSHEHGAPGSAALLTDQVHAAEALLWLHAATSQLPYSMLAAEVLQFAVRTMWDDGAGAFRDRTDPEDPVVPFDLNCRAAVALNRLSAVTGDATYAERAVWILRSQAHEWPRHGLFAASYALAVREIEDGWRPAGLELTAVDWGLD